MENTSEETNVSVTDTGHNRREKVRTIPITFIDSASNILFW